MKKIMAILLLFTTGQSFTMQPLATRTARQLLFSRSRTALLWTLATGESIKSGYDWIKALSDEEKYLVQHTNANQDVTNFITSELEKTHNIKIKGVKVHPIHRYAKSLPKESPDVGSLRQHIVINSTAHDEIYEAIKNNDQKNINKYLAIVNHEGTHQKESHLLWRIATSLTLPFATYGAIKFIGKGMSVGKAVLSAQTIALMNTSLCRYQEYRADNGVPNDAERLTEFKSFLETLDQGRALHLKYFFPFSNKLTEAQLENVSWAANFLEAHPLPKKRIAKLNQRIAALEKSAHNKEDALS
jgi:hypothetical protein